MLISIEKVLTILRIKIKLIIFFLFFFSCQAALADCWNLASQRFNIDKKLLISIAKVESGMKNSAINVNKNGTKDYGLMQINSSHLGWLKDKGIDEKMLISDPCVSVLVGAYILRDMFDIYGYGWEAVGAYNAGTVKEKYTLRMSYAKKVWVNYKFSPVPEIAVPVQMWHHKLGILQPKK